MAAVAVPFLWVHVPPTATARREHRPRAVTLPEILDGLARRGLCAGQLVPDTHEHAPADWTSNTYRATAGPWD